MIQPAKVMFFVVQTSIYQAPLGTHSHQKVYPRGSMTRAFPWLELDDDRKSTLPMGKMVSWINTEKGRFCGYFIGVMA